MDRAVTPAGTGKVADPSRPPTLGPRRERRARRVVDALRFIGGKEITHRRDFIRFSPESLRKPRSTRRYPREPAASRSRVAAFYLSSRPATGSPATGWLVPMSLHH